MLNDLLKISVLTIALVACGGDKTATDSGSEETCDLSCADYCTSFLGACSADASNTYADQADCEAKCESFTCGTAEDTTGDTLGCRTYHAGAAAADPATHCPHANENPTDACI
jgi:hypothetical protein